MTDTPDDLSQVDLSPEAVELLAHQLPCTHWRGPRIFRAADTLRAQAAEISRLRSALDAVTKVAEDFRTFHDDNAGKPCGEYGAECPIQMGEWLDDSERLVIDAARAALRGE